MVVVKVVRVVAVGVAAVRGGDQGGESGGGVGESDGGGWHHCHSQWQWLAWLSRCHQYTGGERVSTWVNAEA